jgi:hypothetical protein
VPPDLEKFVIAPDNRQFFKETNVAFCTVTQFVNESLNVQLCKRRVVVVWLTAENLLPPIKKQFLNLNVLPGSAKVNRLTLVSPSI